MKTSIISIAAVAGALFVSSAAMAATLQPAAGEAPFMDQYTATSTQDSLTRSQVEQQAAAAFPASGNAPFVAAVASNDPDPLSRAQVEAQAAANFPAAGQASAHPAMQGSMAPARAQASRSMMRDAS